MAAGLGFKTFNTGDVLSAADVNGYLMQGVLVFADATARDAAITSPQEGQFAYTKDNNSLWYYSGSAWVASGATGDIEGVTAGVGISGGGTSGTVTVTNSMATAIDAKGDFVVGTGADTFSKLTVGANGTTLVADSAESVGMRWAAASSGGMTLLETLSLSGASVVSSTIPSTYVHLQLVIRNYRPATNGKHLFCRINGDSSANYNNQNLMGQSYNVAFSETEWIFAFGQNNGAGSTSIGYVPIYDYANTTTWKNCYPQLAANGDTTSTNVTSNMYKCYYNQTGAITSLTFLAESGNMTSGDVLIYGVK